MNTPKQIFAKIKNFFLWLVQHKIVLIIFLLIILGGGYYGYKQYQSLNSQPTYQTSQAEKGSLITSVTASGTISSANSSVISTQTSGVVAMVYVKNGDKVYQGQKIADILLDQTGQVKQSSAWSNYVSAQTANQNAKNNLRSAEATLEKVLNDIHLFQYGNGGFDNVGSANETETQKQLRTQAEVAKDNAVDSIKTTETSLIAASMSYQQSSSLIIAPITGIVSNLNLSVGSVIASNTSNSSDSTSDSASQTLGNIIVSQSSLQAKVNLSEVDVTKVKEEQKVTMTLDAFADKTFTGKITSIDTNGSVSSNVTTYPTTITFDTSFDGIYPNMAVSATIITDIKDNALLVPSGAIQNTNGISTVRILNNGQITQTEVETGATNGTQTQILSGVNEGDQVVTSTTSSTTTGTTTSPFSGLNRGFGGAGGAVRITR